MAVVQGILAALNRGTVQPFPFLRTTGYLENTLVSVTAQLTIVFLHPRFSTCSCSFLTISSRVLGF